MHNYLVCQLYIYNIMAIEYDGLLASVIPRLFPDCLTFLARESWERPGDDANNILYDM